MLDVRGTLLRVFLDEDDRLDGQPLHLGIVEAMRGAGFGGATVLKGIEGFGASKALRTSRAVESGRGLPILIEAIERRELVEAFVPKLRSMMHGGTITIEDLDVAHVVRAER
jgi:PII-like signaling protein